MKNGRLILFILSSTLFLSAESLNITPKMSSVTIQFQGKEYTIDRDSRPDHYLTNGYSLTSRPSPPFFIQPFEVTDKVETYGELEVLEFLEKKKGVFIDARLENWYEKSHIAGAVNIPFKIFLSDTPKRTEVLKQLGGKQLANKSWDFSNAETILLYCNGAWCGQSPTAIRELISINYPEEKMKCYRGGMQSWQLLGLSVEEPQKKD